MLTPFIRQTCVVSGVLLTMVEFGMLFGFTTYLLPSLQDPESDIHASLETSSWVAASFGMAFIPGFILSSYYMDLYGRRITFILDLIPGAIGLLLMYFATNIYYLIAARVLQGFTAAATAGLGAVVIGEYSDPVHRGMFLNLKTAAIYLGSGIAHCLGHYYHWRTLTLITLAFYMLNFGAVWIWPESPPWLAMEGNFEECEKNFYWLRGRNQQSTKELKEMVKAQQERAKSKGQRLSKNILTFFRKFTRKDFLLPVRIYFFAAILLEASGRHIFPAYAVQIIAELSASQDPVYYTLCLDILITASSLFSSVLIRLFNRRTLLFVTGAAAFIVLFLSCAYLFLVSRSIISNVPLIPISLFGLYLALVNFACAPIPLALVGEIFPLEHRAVGTTIAGSLIAFISIVVLKTTPILLAAVKVYGTFSILGVAMAVSLIFLYFILPETKNRTLQEIENYFNYGSFNAKNQSEDPEMERIII